MKRVMSLIVLVGVLMSLLAACGSAPAAAPTVAPTVAPTAEAAATEAATAEAAPTEAPTAEAAPTEAAAAGDDMLIKIASHSPLSGDNSLLGVGIGNGAELGVEQMSAKLTELGYTVEIQKIDDQASPEVGTANAKSIVSDPDILCVVGHLNSGVALAALPDYSNASLVMVSPANTNPDITESGYASAFRVVGRDDVQGAVGEQFARETLGIKSVYILHDKTDYGQGVAEFFKLNAEKNGVEVLGFEGTEEKIDFSSILTPIQAANPDLIYFGGLYSQAGPLFRQARDRGITAQFMGPDGLDAADLAKLAGDAVEGMHYTSVAAPVSQFPDAAQYAADYKAKYEGADAPPFSAQAYDSAGVCLAAITKAAETAGAKPTREQVLAAMKEIGAYKGITGTYDFNEKGDSKVATYFVLKANIADWNANELITRLEIPAPAAE